MMLDINNNYSDFIIFILLFIVIILLLLYILKYCFRYHFIIKIDKFDKFDKITNKKEEKDDKTEYILRNDDEKIKKRYFLKDNTFLNDYTATKKDGVKPSYLMIDQLLDKDLQRYYRYVYPKPINDEYYIKKGYNDDDYSETFCKYNLHPLEYINDDLSAGLSKEADRIVLESKN